MLVVSQTIFYLVSSVAIIAVGVLLVIVMYYLICILKDTRKITDDVSQTYDRVKRNVKKIINSLTKNKNEKNK